MRWFRAVASVAGGLTLCVCLPTIAHADYWYASDPEGDVRQITHDPDPEPCGTDTVTPLPDDTTHDITRLRVHHRHDTVAITVRFRDLTTENRRHFTGLDLRTGGTMYLVDVLRFPKGHIEPFLGRLPSDLPPPDECGFSSGLIGAERCQGFTGEWNPDADRVRAVIPRRCLGDPHWIRVSAASYSVRSQRTVIEDRWQPTASSGYFTPAVMRG